MALDFISTYFPEVSEIDAETLKSARQRLDIFLKKKYPDLDSRPNSLFGDLALSPFAHLVAGLEIAAGRMLSDLDLENVAAGVIYNCFRRDTRFITSTGVKSFLDFADGDEITVLTHKGNWKKATVRNYGKQELVPITIRRGKLTYTVHSTKNHRWLLRSGGDTTSVAVGDTLLEGPTIFTPWVYEEATPEERYAWCCGYVFGDGSVMNDSQKNPKWSCVRLCGDKNMAYLDRFLELGFAYSAPKSFKGDVVVYTGSYLKEAPDVAVETPEFMRAFVRGLLDADGSRNYSRPSSIKNNDTKEFLRILTTGDKHKDFVRNTFPVVGQYITYEHDVTDERTNFGRRGQSSNFGLNNYVYDHASKFKIEHIADTGSVEDAWCLSVEDDASFVLPFGLATGNCDFVRKFISNFATVDQTTLKSSGVIRLVFCADSAYTIDRRARYIFGDTNEFTLRLPHPGSMFILPVGSTPTPYANEYVLKQISELNYAVDIGVVGTMTEQVLVGDSGKTDYTVDLADLTSITAVTNFEFGLPSESLAVLAAKTREAFYTSTMTTRSGTRNYMAREFADLAAVSPILPGDTGAVRASVNALGVANGKLDICVQSKNFSTDVTQTVRLDYSATGAAFYGKLDFIEIPQVITSWSATAYPTVDLGVQGPTGDIIVLSQSTDFAKAPLLTSAYSAYEDFWVKIAMPMAGSTAAITPIVEEDGSQYAFFTINYKADPMIKVVSDVLSSADAVPIGVDVLVKGFVPTVINNLLITYSKKPGVRMALDTAREEIYAYFKQLGYNKLYTPSKIYDAMFYAGADDVTSITADSSVQWSVADKILPASVITDPSTYAGFTAAYASSLSLPADVPDTLTASAAFDVTTYGVLEKRNRGYYLAKESIKFSEVVL